MAPCHLRSGRRQPPCKLEETCLWPNLALQSSCWLDLVDEMAEWSRRGRAPKDESGGDGGSSRSIGDGVHIHAWLRQETEDKLYWKHNSSAICNTKSAYKEVVKRENQNTYQPPSKEFSLSCGIYGKPEMILNFSEPSKNQLKFVLQKTQDLQQDNESTRRMNSSTIFLSNNKTIANTMKKRNFEADPRHVLYVDTKRGQSHGWQVATVGLGRPSPAHQEEETESESDMGCL
uniref:Uncharacterized protein n=1 Tax=Oryza meridionalis TaxID=40149 RepID=A0A0E0CSN2_9ORYZ